MNRPYVYRLDNPSTGEFYIGYQSGTKKLGETYFTTCSGNRITKDNFHEFDVTMQLFCDDAQEAYDLEQFLIWADWKKPGMMNRKCHYGKGRWNVTGRKASEEELKRLSIERKGRKLKVKRKMKPFSEEHKANLSKSKLGIKHGPMSDEQKTILSNLKKGKSSPRKGVKLSEETKKKISDSKKGRVPWNKGVAMSEETKKKISDSKKIRKG